MGLYHLLRKNILFLLIFNIVRLKIILPFNAEHIWQKSFLWTYCPVCQVKSADTLTSPLQRKEKPSTP